MKEEPSTLTENRNAGRGTNLIQREVLPRAEQPHYKLNIQLRLPKIATTSWITYR